MWVLFQEELFFFGYMKFQVNCIMYLVLLQKGILNFIVFEFFVIFNIKVELFVFNWNNGFSVFCYICMMFDWCDLVVFFFYEKYENVFFVKR